MSVVAVDLAAKYSAACLLDELGQPAKEWDSWQKSENDFIGMLAYMWYHAATYAEEPQVMVVEDLPHRLPFASLVKRVCRIQGRIIDRAQQSGWLGKVLFVPPAVWRKAYKGLERGTGPDAVVPVAEALGYSPPDLSARIQRAGDKATAKKVATDYCAAFLIGQWARSQWIDHGTFDAPGTSRYDIWSPDGQD